jgi:ribonuclease HII
MRELVCGIDEAGRGPVIGPLVIGCVLLDSEGAKKLRQLSVRDSKKVPREKREELEPIIKEAAAEWAIIKISPREIDLLRQKHSLNQIEAMKTAELILSLEFAPSKIIVDAADPDAAEYGRRIASCLTAGNEDFVLPPMVSEHKADDNYVEVSAASILAKVERDRDIEKLRALHGNLGSGYPSDEVTAKFLKDLIKSGCELPDYVRRSWNTVERSKQSTLFDF